MLEPKWLRTEVLQMAQKFQLQWQKFKDNYNGACVDSKSLVLGLRSLVLGKAAYQPHSSDVVPTTPPSRKDCRFVLILEK